jgi:hypothetical protein
MRRRDAFEKRVMRGAIVPNWYACVIGLAVVNFLVFFVMAIYLGGDALSGKIANGHYYLASHGRYTEVSAAVFTYSKWHTSSVILTHSLAFIAAFLATRRARRSQTP